MVVSAPWFLLPSGFSAIALFPFIFIRKGVKAMPRLLNHERIHLRQQLELLILPIYALYILEFIVRTIIYRNPLKAYRNISSSAKPMAMTRTRTTSLRSNFGQPSATSNHSLLVTDNSLPLLRPHRREEHDVADRLLARHDHRQPVDTKA